MKRTNYYQIILFCIILSSCRNEESPSPEPNTEEPERVTTPCGFDLSTIAENSTITLDCVLDLDGNTVALPANVNFVFDGGDITNGTLVFSGGTIDGDLLSSDLEIEGDVSLKDPIFEFYVSRWGIVETNSSNPTLPSQSEAYTNHVNFQHTINLTKELGATDFLIGKMDAYFDSDSKSAPVAYIPSNFNLKMSDNTTLRVFPVDKDYTSMMFRIYDEENVTVSGGIIIGDRLEHGPTKGSTSLFWITGSRNITVEGINLSFGASGLSVNSISWHDYADQATRPYIPSEDIVIKNNTFDSNEYYNLSITDGYRILIEGNKSYRAGIDVENKYYTSEGQAPRIGIVLEPASDGVGYTQRIEDVTIKDNIVEDGASSSILAVGAFRVNITGNTVNSGLGWTTAASVNVLNNTLIGAGIVGGAYFEAYGIGKSTDNIIANNKITDAATGIFLTNDETEVYDNELSNCTVGIMMNKLIEAEIHDNTITNETEEESWGINGMFYVDNVNIYNNTINLNGGKAMLLNSLNDEVDQGDYKVYIYDNDFNTVINTAVTNSNGVEFTDNDFINAGIDFGGSSNMVFKENNVDSKTGSAITINRAAGSAQNIKILSNTIANTSGNRLAGYGIRINAVGSSFITEDSDVEITDNTISSLGENYSLHSTNFDDVAIINNIITSNEDYVSLYFRGNDSVITNNTVSNGKDIDGNGNTID